MENTFEKILKHRVFILTIFLIGIIGCALMSNSVSVDYNMTNYLPSSYSDFTYQDMVPITRVMIPVSSTAEALQDKKLLSNIGGVTSVEWLDNKVNMEQPFETLDQNIVKKYYSSDNALFFLVIDENNSTETINNIYSSFPSCHIDGSLSNIAKVANSSVKETRQILAFIIPLCLVILLLTTTSWIEPVIILFSVAIAIILNIGTNIIFNQVSFITNAIQTVLQLAITMDYSVFLLHRYYDTLKEEENPNLAMIKALKHTFRSVRASSLTIIICFITFIFMRFKVGPNLGIVMVKAILISLLCTLTLFPSLLLIFNKTIERTRHNSFFPNINFIGNFVDRFQTPLLVLFCILLIPAFLAQRNIIFYYGSSSLFNNNKSVAPTEEQTIDAIFTPTTKIVLLTPASDISVERELSNQLKTIPYISNIDSYVDSKDIASPSEFVSAENNYILSDDRSTFIITINASSESTACFQTLENIGNTANTFFPNKYRLSGESVNTYNMKYLMQKDYSKIYAIVIIAVLIVLVLTFQSFSLPIILLGVLSIALWLNLMFAYFGKNNLYYIAYVLIGTIQIGTTIDYAISITNMYISVRNTQDKRGAITQTVSRSILPVITSAAILTISGFLLGEVTENLLVSQIGYLIGRGALVSLILVLGILPILLYKLDNLIQNTTNGLRFKNRTPQTYIFKVVLKQPKSKAVMEELATPATESKKETAPNPLLIEEAIIPLEKSGSRKVTTEAAKKPKIVEEKPITQLTKEEQIQRNIELDTNPNVDKRAKRSENIKDKIFSAIKNIEDEDEDTSTSSKNNTPINTRPSIKERMRNVNDKNTNNKKGSSIKSRMFSIVETDYNEGEGKRPSPSVDDMPQKTTTSFDSILEKKTKEALKSSPTLSEEQEKAVKLDNMGTKKIKKFASIPEILDENSTANDSNNKPSNDETLDSIDSIVEKTEKIDFDDIDSFIEKTKSSLAHKKVPNADKNSSIKNSIEQDILKYKNKDNDDKNS